MTGQTHSEPRLDAAVFEGMFIRAIRPDADLQAKLRAAGFDITRIQRHYPASVWRSSLEVTRRQLFPEISRERGYHALGQKFVDGYFETIIGKVLAVPFRFMGPERVIAYIPKVLKVVRPDIKLDPPVKEDSRRWRIHFHVPEPLPDFYAGAVEAASRRTAHREGFMVDIDKLDAAGFDLVLRW